MLAHCLDYIDMLSEHYLLFEQHAHRSEVGEEGQYRTAITDRVGACAGDTGPREIRALSGVSEAHSGLRAKPVRSPSTNGPTWAGRASGSYKTVPAYAWAFHEMFRHSDIFQLGLHLRHSHDQ